MKKIQRIIIVFILMLVVINFQLININGKTTDNDEITSDIFSENQIIVVIKTEYSKLTKEFDLTYFSDIKCLSIDELTKGTYDCIMNGINPNNTINISEFRRIFNLTLDINIDDDINEIINKVKNKIEVEDAFPNFKIKFESTSENITNNNYKTSDAWWYYGEYGISIEEAWNYTKGSDSIIVGVIDTGIDNNHADLDSNVYSLNSPVLHRDFTDFGNPFYDKVGHGTHVAGIIGAKNDGKNLDDLEVIGVCQNVKLVSLKLSNRNYTDDYIECENDLEQREMFINSFCELIDYAIEYGIEILNYSGYIFGDLNNTEYVDDVTKIEYSIMINNLIGFTLANYDGLLICAAGNQGINGLNENQTPAIYSRYSDRIITVGSINKDGEKSGFSNGDDNYVSIFAPGENIISTFPTNLDTFILNEYDETSNIFTIKDINNKNTKYISLSGTSMATPFVTGVATLLKSINQSITAEQIKRTILENSDFNRAVSSFCVSDGTLNAFKAVSAVVFEVDPNMNNGLIINGFKEYYEKENCNKLIIPEEFSPYKEISDRNNGISNNPLLEQKIVVSIGVDAFKNNTYLESIELPNTIQVINDSAFEGCNNLITVSLPNSIETLGDCVFKNCSSIENIILPSSISIINQSLFEGCANLREIVIPHGVTLIESSAFKGCTNLEKIVLPSTITKIESSAFEGCVSLKEINLPNSISTIGASAFEGCISLEEIMIPSNLTTIDSNTFEGCINLKDVEIPEGIININSSAFDTCESLEQIILPNTIEYIGMNAFYGCENIEVISLPNSLISIDSEAFRYCINLKSVNVNKEGYPLIDIGSEIFKNCSSLNKINVPSDKVAKYKNAINWSSYKNIISSDYELNEIDVRCHINYNENVFIEESKDFLFKLNVKCNCLYTFNINSVEEINIDLYDNQYNQLDFNIIYEDENIYKSTVFLNEGTFYLDICFNNNIDSDKVGIGITTDITSIGYELEYNIDNNISNHLHQYGTNYISYLRYTNRIGKGLYKLSLTGVNINYLLSESIMIYNDSERISLANCYSISNFDNLATSKDNENVLYLYMEYNNTYYIDIKIGSINSNIGVIIEKVTNELDFTLFQLDNVMSNDLIEILDENDDTSLNTSFFKKVNIKESGLYSTSIYYNGTQNSNIIIVFLKDDGEIGYSNIGIYTINNSNPIINTSYILLKKGTYYIGYYNLDKTNCESLSVSFRRFTENDSDSAYNTFIVDPNSSGMYGSHIAIVERNKVNKSYGETFITKGFSRLIFIDGSYGYSNSRLDYEWYSSDTNVMIVTQFGTVLGKEIGTAKIVAINKTNPSIMFIKEFTVIDNENKVEELIIINQTYSLSSIDNCVINLTVQNSPYPMIQYYDLCITYCTGEAELDVYGNIEVTVPCEITIEGYYLLNCKYKVKIIFEVIT